MAENGDKDREPEKTLHSEVLRLRTEELEDLTFERCQRFLSLSGPMGQVLLPHCHEGQEPEPSVFALLLRRELCEGPGSAFHDAEP